jgi:signal transduction histidine kinase
MTRMAQSGSAARSLWRPPRADVALAALVAVAQISFTVLASSRYPGHDLDPLAVSLLACGPIALAWRRRFPLTVYGVVFAITLAYWLGGFPKGPVFLALIVAFGTLLLAGHRRVAWASLGLGYVLFTWLAVLIGTEDAPTVAESLGLAAWLLVLGTSTEILRIRRERATELARAHEEEQRLRSTEERLRLARELHDTVAHHLSLINVQAATALHLIDQRPAHAEGALAAIKQASGAALDELHALLDLMRTGGETAPRVPTPTIADLEALVDRTSAAGVPVELDIDGVRRPLAAPIETTAYRVAQEALTNVARHAGPTHAVVLLSYRPDALVVQIDDHGHRSREVPIGVGSGLAGMRERVQALGGSLDAAPRAGDGFRVRAWIPIAKR